MLYARAKSLTKRMVDLWLSTILLAALTVYVCALSPAVLFVRAAKRLFAGRKRDVQKSTAPPKQVAGTQTDDVCEGKEGTIAITNAALPLATGPVLRSEPEAGELIEPSVLFAPSDEDRIPAAHAPNVHEDVKETSFELVDASSETLSHPDHVRGGSPIAAVQSEQCSPVSTRHSRFSSTASSAPSTPFDYSIRFPLTPAEEEFPTPSTDYSEHDERGHLYSLNGGARLFGLGLVSDAKEEPARRMASPPASIAFPASFSSPTKDEDQSFADATMPLDVSMQEERPAKPERHVEFATSPTFNPPSISSIHLDRPAIPKRKSSRIPVSTSMSTSAAQQDRKPSIASFPPQSSPKMASRSRTSSQGSTSSSSPLLPSAPGSLRSRQLSFTRPDNTSVPFPRRPIDSPTLDRPFDPLNRRRHSRTGSLPDIFSQTLPKTRKTRQSASTINQ